MAKNKKSTAKRPNKSTNSNFTPLPSFNEQALSALTDTLDKKLGKDTALPQTGLTVNKKQGKKSNGAPLSGSKNPRGIETGRGTKRDAQGNAKAADNQSQSKTKKNNGGEDGRSTLLQEILALDGTEEDLNLLENAASDNEDLVTEDSKSLDKSLQKELAKFAASLGIEAQVIEDASEPEDEEDLVDSEEEQEEEWEEASDMESDAEAEVAPLPVAKKPVKAITPATKTSDAALTKEANRLVSMMFCEVIDLANIL